MSRLKSSLDMFSGPFRFVAADELEGVSVPLPFSSGVRSVALVACIDVGDMVPLWRNPTESTAKFKVTPESRNRTAIGS